MKNLFCLFLATASLAACSKKEVDPQPTVVAPIQAATINMAFDYYATGGAAAETQSLSLLATQPTYRVLFTDRLEVQFDALNTNNFVQGQVQFVIPISRQKSGLVGTYTLASQPDTGLGEVLVTYMRPSYSSIAYSNVYSGYSSRLEGSFVITGYDAARHQLSGSYSVKAFNGRTPFLFIGPGSSGDSRRLGDLRLRGTFQEIPLK